MALGAPPRSDLPPPDRDRRCDVNAVVAHNLRAIRKIRGLTQEQVAERLAAFTGHRLPQASISAMERTFDSGRRRLFDAHTLYLLSKVFDVPIIYFFLPPPGYLDRTLDGTNDPVGSLLESSLGTSDDSMTIIDRRLVETASSSPDGTSSQRVDASELRGIERWRSDLRRMSEIDCNARLREIADLLRALADLHGRNAAGA